jgi:hypothetical protein
VKALGRIGAGGVQTSGSFFLHRIIVQSKQAVFHLSNVPKKLPILRLVNHGTDHRAQVLRLLHDLGAPTFNQDLIIYLWEL